MKRTVIKFKDGTIANLSADAIIIGDDNLLYVWRGEQDLIGVVDRNDITAIYITEKGTKE